MASPTLTEVQNNTFSYNGEPFNVAGLSSADTATNVFAYNGEPLNVPVASANRAFVQQIIIF